MGNTRGGDYAPSAATVKAILTRHSQWAAAAKLLIARPWRPSVYGSAAREQPAREVHELGIQQWLERHACTELVQFGGDGVIERVVASDDGHWRVAMPLIRAQPPKKFDAVGEWHPEVDKNCIRTARLHRTHPAFRRERRPHLEPFRTDRLRKN